MMNKWLACFRSVLYRNFTRPSSSLLHFSTFVVEIKYGAEILMINFFSGEGLMHNNCEKLREMKKVDLNVIFILYIYQ